MSSSLFYSFKTGLMNGVFDLNSDVIKVALMNASYPEAFNSITQTKWSDISSYEIDPLSPPTIGYTAGGNAIACTVTLDVNTAQLNTTGTDGNGNSVWINSTITAYGAVIYDSSADNSPLIAWIDFGGIQRSSTGNFTVSWASVNNIIVGLN